MAHNKQTGEAYLGSVIHRGVRGVLHLGAVIRRMVLNKELENITNTIILVKPVVLGIF